MAKRLVRAKHKIANAHPLPGTAGQAMGLLALMLFHRARQAARVNDRGDLVTLEGQDRTRWDQTQIELARRHLEAASPHGGPASSYAAWCGGWPASR